MTVIRIREHARDGAGAFRARVSFGDESEYEVTVADPADEAMAKNLAWYFEEHLRYPFLDKDREGQAVAQIASYGELLFGQVFGGDASHDYRNLRARAFDGCRVEISGSAAFHGLHWEALRDPGMTVPLSVRMPVTRRAERQPSRFEVRSDLAALNIVVVTARPDGPRDVGYRTISRPLLDSLRIAGLPVTVDLVRPGTWQALRDHLRSATEQHGSGWYQVIHFDVHGAFWEYTPLTESRQAGRLSFSPGLFSEFAGQRGFLFFETGMEKQAEPVPAEAVADLLEEHRIPVAILNACQSAMQSDSEAGLAQRLAEAGVPVALGMAYSVTVSAAERAMPVLYRRIASGDDLTAAVTAARRDLLEHRGRQGYFGMELELQDWMLPVMFAQRSFRLRLQPMADHEYKRFHERQAVVAEEPPTEYGFVGRDLDIQAIEHRLLANPDANELLVQGMAGAGKSTLLAHLAWWWQRTGLVDGVFRFSYEDRAWTASQIVREIRSVLMSPAEHARADMLPEEAQAGQVAGLLRAARHLLIVDNAESIVAAPAAIPHALSPAERDKLKSFLSRLRGGRTLVLLGSRGPEEWLTAGHGPGIYPLPGLDPQAASLLVDKILAKHAAVRWLADSHERQALQDLVTLLGGYPLPLTVVLPLLASAPPSQVLAELREGDPGPDPAGLIIRAIEYSHGKLDPTLQNSLQLLAPFTAVIGTGPILGRYRELLLQDEVVRAIGEIDLAASLAQAVSVGLAAPHPQISNLVQVQPVLPWFLRNRLVSQPALRAAISQAHYRLYQDDLSPSLMAAITSADDSKGHLVAMAAVFAEYANMRIALSYGLRAGQPIMNIVWPLDEYLRLTGQLETRRQLLEEAINAYPPEAQAQQGELAELCDLAGRTALDERRFDDARSYYEEAMRMMEAAGQREQQRSVYHQLGRVAQMQRRYDEAEVNFKKALDMALEFEDRRDAAFAHAQLGRIALDQNRVDQAEASYKRALDIFLQTGDRYNAGQIYNNLGAVAFEQGRLEEAEASYRQALEVVLEFRNLNRVASLYTNLGAIAHAQGRIEQAEAIYRRALDISLEYGDRHLTGFIFDKLGSIAQSQKRYNEAEASYRKAFDTFQESDPLWASDTAHQLGIVLSELGRHGEAISVWLRGAVIDRQETGQWDRDALQRLGEARALIDPTEFRGLVLANVPADLADDLAAILAET